jgi:alkylhydroperoxidase family enzyme
MAQILDCRAALAGSDEQLLARLENWSDDDGFGALEKAALDYTEQFMYSATDITEEQIETLTKELGVKEPSTFVYGLYINEAALRVLAFLDVEPSEDGMDWISAGRGADEEKSDRDFIEWVDDDSETDPKLLAAYYAFNRATCKEHGIDEVTDDLVRLRSADYHNCQFCKSVRRNVEWPDGVDDLMREAMNYRASDKINGQQRAALELLDAMVVAPIKVDEDLQVALLEHMTPEQIVELLMKEAFWMSNKPMISLKTDPGAVSPDHATEFEYDQEGNFIITGAPRAAATA